MKYYQPAYDEEIWFDKDFYSFMVYHKKETAEKDFPELKIIEYKNGDIEEPIFID